jgi:predicted MFS family arabinose efflux permease
MIVRNGKGFSESLVNISLPAFTILFIIAATLGGIYDKRYRPLKAFYATVTAILVMLAAYALLPGKIQIFKGSYIIGGIYSYHYYNSFQTAITTAKDN